MFVGIQNPAFASLALLCAVAVSACGADGAGPASGSGSAGRTDSQAGSGSVHQDDGMGTNGQVVGDGSHTDTGFPNDGSVGGLVLAGSSIIAGDGANPAAGFVCTRSASLFEGATTEVGANGLVGSAVSGLVDALGGASVSDLLNTVVDADLAIDTDLKTAASFTQTAAGLDLLLGAGQLDSVDLNVIMPEGLSQPAGAFAVFAISFPGSLLDAGLLSSVTVTTLLDGVVQEDSAAMDASGLALLGGTLAGPEYAFIGYQASLPYDTARISISSSLLSADAGANLYVHEMCTDGDIVAR